MPVSADSAEPWKGDYDEPCVCGHPGDEHCLDDMHCCWSHNMGERGGACLAGPDCGCATYRPKSINPEDDDESGDEHCTR